MLIIYRNSRGEVDLEEFTELCPRAAIFSCNISIQYKNWHLVRSVWLIVATHRIGAIPQYSWWAVFIHTRGGLCLSCHLLDSILHFILLLFLPPRRSTVPGFIRFHINQRLSRALISDVHDTGIKRTNRFSTWRISSFFQKRLGYRSWCT